MTENNIASIVVDAAYRIHKTLGPGLFESVYEAALEFELRKRGLRVVQQVGLPVHYEEVKLEVGFRVDLIVNEKVIVEIKSVEVLAPVHKKQLLTYLRLTELRLGLLINFNVELLKHGIQRVINEFMD
ncbi:MAG TPA: GxxExxY protein [Pyrinomonadaceae bacterium]|jgi:GxxExxY protein|nr:GxxExxY protein [Pyrinomonadaceae bacterium]